VKWKERVLVAKEGIEEGALAAVELADHDQEEEIFELIQRGLDRDIHVTLDIQKEYNKQTPQLKMLRKRFQRGMLNGYGREQRYTKYIS